MNFCLRKPGFFVVFTTTWGIEACCAPMNFMKQGVARAGGVPVVVGHKNSFEPVRKQGKTAGRRETHDMTDFENTKKPGPFHPLIDSYIFC